MTRLIALFLLSLLHDEVGHDLQGMFAAFPEIDEFFTELVFENSEDHLFWLLYGTAAAVTFALRRLLVRQGRWALAVATAAIGLIGGISLYVFAQGAADPKAGVIAAVTVLCTAGTVWMVERPARLQEPAYATGPA